MIKVCHITSTHKSHDQRILLKECVALSKNGYDVSLVAQGHSDNYNGVQIIGSDEDKGSAFYRLISRPWHVYRRALKVDADIYQIHDMELLPYAVKLKRKGKKVIFDYHEDFASRFADSDVFHLPKLLMRIMGSIYVGYEKRSIAKLDAMISVTPHICDRLAKINTNTVMITNYPLMDDNWGAPVCYEKNSDYFCFVGQMSDVAYCLNTAVSAIQKFPNMCLKMCGPARRDGDIENLRWLDTGGHMDYLGILPYQELPALLSNAKAALITCVYSKDTAGKRGTLGSNKLFEAMLCGVPVICTDFDLWRQIVDQYHCGISITPGDERQLIDAFTYIINNPEEAEQMGLNGRQAVEQEFNWKTEEKKLLDLYANIAAQLSSGSIISQKRKVR